MLEFHPFADLFPLIEGREFDELVEDIRQNGLREKIVIFEGKILDGRNRYRALVSAGMLAESAEPFGKIAAVFFSLHVIASHGDPLKWVLSKNLHRRHLSESQRAMIAARLATMGQGRPSTWRDGLDDKSSNLSNLSDVKQTDAAEMLSVSRSSVQTAGRVLEHGAPELVQAVEKGEVAVSAAAAVAQLPLEEQELLLQSVDKKALAKVAKERLGTIRNGRATAPTRVEPDGLDYFPTPPWATRALLEDVLFEQLGIDSHDFSRQLVWEPACGEGHMSGVLDEYTEALVATDVHDYSAEGRHAPGWFMAHDFLNSSPVEGDLDWIITNPPFADDKTLQFALRAIDLAKIGVALFVRSQWAVEGVERYLHLFRDHPPTLVAFFAERVPLHKGRWEPDGSTLTAYCWLVWIKGEVPNPPFWIPPGRRIERSREGDMARFTAHPVLAQPIELQRDTPNPPAAGAGVVPANADDDAGQAAPSFAGPSSAATLPPDINQLIRDGYAETPFPGVEEIGRRTGLKPDAVKKRASRMGLGSVDRQRAAVIAANQRRFHAEEVA